MQEKRVRGRDAGHCEKEPKFHPYDCWCWMKPRTERDLHSRRGGNTQAQCPARVCPEKHQQSSLPERAKHEDHGGGWRGTRETQEMKKKKTKHLTCHPCFRSSTEGLRDPREEFLQARQKLCFRLFLLFRLRGIRRTMYKHLTSGHISSTSQIHLHAERQNARPLSVRATSMRSHGRGE